MQFEILIYAVVGVLLNAFSNLIAEWIIRYIKATIMERRT